MKLFISSLFFLLVSFISLPSAVPVFAASLTYANGYYTNLCGTGTAATADTCNKGCNPQTGSCTSDKPYVFKWTCSGNMQECRLNEAPAAVTQNIGNTQCDQTVSIQVYNRNCRSYFGWICNETNLQDSMLWYSGGCAPTVVPQTNAPTQAGSSVASVCEELTVTKGNNNNMPATIGFHTRATGAYGYRFYFGDGTMVESALPDTEHRYDVSGSFVSRVEIKNKQGGWTGSGRCETSVFVQPNALETQKSDCSDLFIIDGNDTQAPTTVSLRVTGYDNKGTIATYRITGDANQSVENPSGAFQMRFEKPGTYTLHGSILDSTNAWKTGGTSCTKTVYVRTTAITQQPETGTPTALTIFALSSGIIGISFLLSSRSASGKKMKRAKRRAHRAHA